MARLTSVSTFRSLAIRDYRLLWMGQVGASMGQWMDQVSRTWLIYHVTGSPLQLGFAAAARGLPLLVFGVVAGVVADRSGRKTQLIVAQGLNAFLNVILATLVLAGKVQPWHIYATGVLSGTVQAFQQPARQTLISDIVGTEHLMNALALNSAVLNASRAVGPAIAGVLIATVGADGSYYAQAAVYLFATVWTLQMRVPDRGPEGLRNASQPFFQSMSEGIGYVWRERDLRALMILALGPLALAFPYNSLMPIFAKDVLHGGPRLQGALLTCVGVGSLTGALIVASMRRKYAYGLSVIVGAAAFGLGVMCFSLSRWVFLSAGLAFITGAFSVTYTTQDQTLAQVLAPRHLRGRVMSIYLLSRGLIPMGALMAGALAGVLGGPRAMAIMAGSSTLVVLLVALSTPSFVRLRIPLSRERDGVPAPATVEAQRASSVEG